ncbi:MAG: threonylcarbamoyl-AMP synthase [Candidatus Moranbacteria bacterium]|nr:threonylcarbamoyl-AMP synthase [Candidatus Moranbacteria bacterium]
MRIVDLYSDNSNLKEVVEISVRTLEEGGVFVYPTDTVYGIGCDALKTLSVKRIKKIKKRASKKPFSVIMRDLEMMDEYVYLSEKDKKIVAKFLPGRFTFVFKGRNKLSSEVVSEEGKVGVRIPDFRLTREISKNFERPYVSTSVNLSGEESLVVGIDIKLMYDKLKNKPDLMIDAGRLGRIGKPPKPSTVVDLSEKRPRILRAGEWEVREIFDLLSDF